MRRPPLPTLFPYTTLFRSAARVDFRQMLSESRRLPDSYFKGLNFLLNEEPDRAIDAFIEVAKLDSEDRKSTRLNSSHVAISYAVFCLKKKKPRHTRHRATA